MTEIVFILDRSGSMSGLESDTIGGLNSMIKKQQTDLESKALVSTILFDHESIVLHDRIPITEVKPLTEKDYEVRGSTALLDAIGEAVKHIKNVHKYAREEDRPEKTLFVITTDGMENASEKFSFRDIKELVDKQKELGWEFIFLGANIDAIEVADSIGIDARRAVNYHADSRGTSELFGAVGDFMNFFADSTPLRRNDDDE
ncbi:MAG: VWA domain-containing protein [Selenomonadaceae bacterium]|nr:VWA domain-containing protein [Selenomonadaceae bacterium]